MFNTIQLVDVVHQKTPIALLVEDFKSCSEELERLAEAVPETELETHANTRREKNLYARRTSILARAAKLPVESETDIRALLELWHIETVEETAGRSITPSEKLVRSVCGYFGIV